MIEIHNLKKKEKEIKSPKEYLNPSIMPPSTFLLAGRDLLGAVVADGAA